MAKGKLFEYVILYHPKEKKDNNQNVIDQPSVLITKEPVRVLATSDKQVGMLAAKGIPDQYNDKLDDIEIVIRPF